MLSWQGHSAAVNAGPARRGITTKQAGSSCLHARSITQSPKVQSTYYPRTTSRRKPGSLHASCKTSHAKSRPPAAAPREDGIYLRGTHPNHRQSNALVRRRLLRSLDRVHIDALLRIGVGPVPHQGRVQRLRRLPHPLPSGLVVPEAATPAVPAAAAATTTTSVAVAAAAEPSGAVATDTAAHSAAAASATAAAAVSAAASAVARSAAAGAASIAAATFADASLASTAAAGTAAATVPASPAASEHVSAAAAVAAAS